MIELRVKQDNGRYRVATAEEIGRAAAQCHLELIKRKAQLQTITSPEGARGYLTTLLEHREREVFAVVFLDNRHRIIDAEELFFGTIDAASVHPREVVKAALRHNAAAVILAHNHPSGEAEPSQADIRITERLRDALQLIDVRVLDHFVVGAGTVTSFVEQNLL